MERSSYFVKDRALFGGYPRQEEVDELESVGVVCFVNLTYDTERKITPYETSKKLIYFPIPDHGVPTDKVLFAGLIALLTDLIRSLEQGQRIYVHCKGGHGRSALVVSCILHDMYRYNAEQVIELTTIYHTQRPKLKNKWRNVVCPHHRFQRKYVYNFCEQIVVSRGSKTSISNCLLLSSRFSVETELGVFPTAEAALFAYKNSHNKRLVEGLKGYDRLGMLRQTSTLRQTDTDSWLRVRFNFLERILLTRIDQWVELRDTTISTCLRPILYHCRGDGIGDFVSSIDRNLALPVILERIRRDLLLAHYRSNTRDGSVLGDTVNPSE